MKNPIHIFKEVFSNRRFTSAFLFAIFLYTFEEFLFNHPQRTILQTIIIFRPQREIIIAMVSGITSFIYCFLLIWVALGSSLVFRLFYIFLFTLSTFVQYGFGRGLGRFISTTDLQIVSATPIDIWKGAATLYLDRHFIFPVTVFLLLALTSGQKETWKKSLTYFTGLFVLTILLGLSRLFIDSTLVLGTSLSSYYQTTAQYAVETLLPRQRENLHIETNSLPQKNIVLIIDESIRGDHLSINGYKRETTPFLETLAQQDGNFYNWGPSASGATCSYASNILILTGVRPGLDEFKNTLKYPTIFQYAKVMGYTTYYMDAQTNSLWNGLANQDMTYIDKWYKAADMGDDYQSDFRGADLITQITSSGTGNFIVFNKRGVHFLYQYSYPPEAAIWKPIPADYIAQPDLVTNPYDNGIRYNVDTFLERLFSPRSMLDNTVIIYTSDHGQTLFENGVDWLHCNFTLQEATVPLFIWGRNLSPVDTGFHASHSNIMPSILDIMKVPEGQRVHPYAPSLFSAKANTDVDRFFFDGSLDLVDYPDQ
jgi:glucan phosphoethanolaminetransferase (alkaline phosphatase superfamily)